MFGATGTAMIETAASVPPRIMAGRRPTMSVKRPAGPSATVCATAPIANAMPVHVAGPWSALFHFFHGFSAELRDITLFHELLNKQGRAFTLTIGPPIPPAALAGEAVEATARLKAYVEQVLPAEPHRPFA